MHAAYFCVSATPSVDMDYKIFNKHDYLIFYMGIHTKGMKALASLLIKLTWEIIKKNPKKKPYP